MTIKHISSFYIVMHLGVLPICYSMGGVPSYHKIYKCEYTSHNNSSEHNNLNAYIWRYPSIVVADNIDVNDGTFDLLEFYLSLFIRGNFYLWSCTLCIGMAIRMKEAEKKRVWMCVYVIELARSVVSVSVWCGCEITSSPGVGELQ